MAKVIPQARVILVHTGWSSRESGEIFAFSPDLHVKAKSMKTHT